jgi:hypothetical protein
MPRTEFFNMQCAFYIQFGSFMVLEGHCPLSVQFFTGWELATELNNSTTQGN